MRKCAVLFLLLPLAAACGSGSSTETKRQECLYAAVAAYPSLPVSSLATDHVKACEGLSVSDKSALRTMMGQFIDSALEKSASQ
jgi:hypothetical protein